MQLEEISHNFKTLLCSLNYFDEKLAMASKVFQEIFSVRPFEVALFGYDRDDAIIFFICPPELKHAGAIPINAPNSLVASTVATRTGRIDNFFASTAHLRIFESFRQKGDDLTPIQKIMSVPMIHMGLLIGVIQINRRGKTLESAGPDFTVAQLKVLTNLANILASHLST